MTKPKQAGWEIEMENNIKYWLRENLSTLPMSLRYEELLELNEPILISSVLKITEVLLSRQRAEIVERIKNMPGTIPLGELSTIVWFRKDDVLSALESGEGER